MSQMTKMEKKIDKLDARSCRVEVQLEGLKIKSGIWGLMGACIPAAIAIIYTITQL